MNFVFLLCIDPTEDSTVDVVPPDVRAASPRETANSRPHSPHVTDTASGTSSQPLSNILSSVLYLSQKEEEKQAELESVQMRMGRLHNWLQQILNHLANFDVRQTKVIRPDLTDTHFFSFNHFLLYVDFYDFWSEV